MKKIIILSVIVMLWACDKSSHKEEEIPVVKNETFSFEVGIKEGVNVSNFRVGNQIPIEVLGVTDTNAQSHFVYVLNPTGNDATRHQVLGKDYTLLQKEGSNFKEVDRFEIADISSLPSFYVVPKVPGTFQLDFQLRKYNTTDKKFVGEPVVKQLVFSAVKINFSFPTQEIEESSFWNHSVHKREFKFTIDDGNREYDSYLSNYAGSKRYEYVTYYDNQVKSGEFRVGQFYDFRDHIETKKGPIPMSDVPQTMTIEITQYLHNGLKNIIRYEDVWLEY